MTRKVKEYGISLPYKKSDLSLVCPSYTKKIEENYLLACLVDAKHKLLLTQKKKKESYSKEVQTDLKNIQSKLVYDYKYGENQIEETGV